MTNVDFVRLIGWTHLLQPPLTAYLASPRGLDLARSLVSRTELGGAVLHNLAIASVALPTALGVLLAIHAEELARSPALRSLALLLACFWSWRLYRQLVALGPRWPDRPRSLRHAQRLLTCIFVAQGPLLAFFALYDF
jgi:hypothetical protein